MEKTDIYGEDFPIAHLLTQRGVQMERRLLALCLVALIMPGCAVHELRSDQEKIRDTLVELNTNQVLDNLVRASRGLPIIQIDYTNASASVTLEEAATSSNAFQSTNGTGLTSTVAKVGAAVATSFAVTANSLNTLLGGMTANHTNQIAITGTPVLTSNELYDAYLAFLGVPDHLQVTANPPAPGAAHLCKRVDKCYHWVPVQFKKDYYDLATMVTAQRDRMLSSPADEYYVVTLKGATPYTAPKLPAGQTGFEEVDKRTFIVDIDKEVPNPDTGGIIVFSDQTTTPFAQYRNPDNKTVQMKTQKLKVIYRTSEKLSFTPDLSAKDVKTLNAQKLPDVLREAFKRGGKELSAGAAVSKITDKKWTITDGDKTFTAELLGDTITQITQQYRAPLGATDPCAFENKLNKTPHQTVTLHYIDEGIRPSAPTTSELLDRIEFRHPQIQLKAATPNALDSPNR